MVAETRAGDKMNSKAYDCANGVVVRKAYHSPQLIILGGLGEIVQSGASDNSDGDEENFTHS